MVNIIARARKLQQKVRFAPPHAPPNAIQMPAKPGPTTDYKETLLDDY
ncbi:hypothetical protein M3J09_004109 [Ascochyta lentis]